MFSLAKLDSSNFEPYAAACTLYRTLPHHQTSVGRLMQQKCVCFLCHDPLTIYLNRYILTEKITEENNIVTKTIDV